MKIMKDEWFPFVTKSVKAKHGWDMYYYGNVAGRRTGRSGGGRRGGGAAPSAGRRRRRRRPEPSSPPPAAATRRIRRAWGTFEHVPALPQQLRRHAQPVRAAERGLRLRDVRGSHQGDELLHGRGADVRASERRPAQEGRPTPTRKRSSAKTLATRAGDQGGGMIEILMGEVEDELNPVNGALHEPPQGRGESRSRWSTASGSSRRRRRSCRPSTTCRPTATRAIELLRAHGIQMRRLTAAGARRRAVRDHRAIRSGRRATSIDTGNHALRTLEGDWRPAARRHRAGRRLGGADEPAARAARVLPARADVGRRPDHVELARRSAPGREGVSDDAKDGDP